MRPARKSLPSGRRSRRRARSSICRLSATLGLMACMTLVREASWAGLRVLMMRTAKVAIDAGIIVPNVT